MLAKSGLALASRYSQLVSGAHLRKIDPLHHLQVELVRGPGRGARADGYPHLHQRHRCRPAQHGLAPCCMKPDFWAVLP